MFLSSCYTSVLKVGAIGVGQSLQCGPCRDIIRTIQYKGSNCFTHHQGSASQRRAKTGKFLCVHGPDDSESLDVIMEWKLNEMQIIMRKKI